MFNATFKFLSFPKMTIHRDGVSDTHVEFPEMVSCGVLGRVCERLGRLVREQY